MLTKNKFITLIIVAGLSVICCGSAYADHDVSELNTLFTDKRQRATIDAARSGSGNNKTTLEQQKTNKVTIDGYVTRSDGKDVVWVNNRNTLDGYTVGGVKVQRSKIGKNKKVGVTLDGTHIHLKPGETWSEAAGISDVVK